MLYPFTAAVTALLYIDLRMRREGLDVELIRASDAGSTACAAGRHDRLGGMTGWAA